jgi:hypothetical protein
MERTSTIILRKFAVFLTLSVSVKKIYPLDESSPIFRYPINSAHTHMDARAFAYITFKT